MNDTGGGVTAIHDVPGDITRIGFHWMLFFPFCHSKGASVFSSHGESRKVTGFLCPELSNFRIFSSHGMSRNNLFLSRIIECLSHGMSRRSRFFCPEFFPCPEFSNFRIVYSHGRSRSVAVFLSRDLSLDPLTNGR